jgi:hypothetical protein
VFSARREPSTPGLARSPQARLRCANLSELIRIFAARDWILDRRISLRSGNGAGSSGSLAVSTKVDWTDLEKGRPCLRQL